MAFLNREWYEALAREAPVARLYEASPVAPATLEQPDRFCREFKPFPEVRAVRLGRPAGPGRTGSKWRCG
ncbi:MAG: hypothetical protein IMX00_11245 [Limnochordales bacterium]|nr:hypothetical protein [Limnochordales bacterium]